MRTPEPQHHRCLSLQSKELATELVNKLPAAALAALVSTISTADVAQAADFVPPPTQQQAQAPSTIEFQGAANLTAPEVKTEYQLPEGTQWRYSEFITVGTCHITLV